MSTILPKDRQPFTLDFAFDALQTAFLSGPGAVLSQISDDQGHQFYATDSALHQDRGEIESDPTRRLRGVARWPWYAKGRARQAQPGELYFIRGAASRTDLHFTVNGSEYKLLHFQGRNMLEVAVTSQRRVKDVIRISPPVDGLPRRIEIKPVGGERVVNLRALRAEDESGAWRSVEIKNARLSRAAFRVDLLGELDHVEVSGMGKKVEFRVNLSERRNRKLTSRKIEKAAAEAAKPFQADLQKRRGK
jgi:hypothetical protein